jgi:hypothetical protein
MSNRTKPRYDTARWRRVRRAYIAAHPICQDPSGCTAQATDVHHLDGQGLAGPRAYDWDNLQALCHSHHSQRTAREQPGGWNASPPRRRPAQQHPGLVDQPGVGGTPSTSNSSGRRA